MRTQYELENDRHWTVFSALCLFMAMLFGAIFYGYFAFYMWIWEYTEGQAELLAHAFAVVAISVCLTPGLIVWRKLRGRGRYGALYGLMIAAAMSIAVPLLLGAPLGASPKGQFFENIVL